MELFLKKNKLIIEQISQEIYDDNKLSLGTRKFSNKNRFFKKEKIEFLSLDLKKQMENILIVGSAGSGKTLAMYGLMLSNMINGRGFVYFDFKPDASLVNSILKMARLCDREKDVVSFTIKQRDKLNKNTISELINKNKIVLFPCMFDYSKDKETSHLEDLITRYLDELLNTKYTVNYFPYTVFLSDICILSNDFQSDILFKIKQLNKQSVNFCLDTYDFNSSFKNNSKSLLSVFNNILLFKIEDPYFINEFFEFDKQKLNFRDIVSSRPGEFYYSYKSDINTNKIFKAFYLN
jgi:hypothetical protein